LKKKKIAANNMNTAPLILTGSQDISVAIATRLWTGQPRSTSPDSGKTFPSPVFRLALKPNHSRIKWIPRALSPGIKLPECEAHHSLPSSIEINNVGGIPPNPMSS
jgi:hypothetical protein